MGFPATPTDGTLSLGGSLSTSGGGGDGGEDLFGSLD